MVSQRASALLHTPKRAYIYLLLFGLLLYLVVPQISHFHESFDVLAGVNFWGVALGVVLTFATLLLAAAIYVTLALKKLSYAPTALVEVSSVFASRLLPAGLGGLGLHGLYLHKQKHSVAEATAVVSTNNALGIVGHLFLLVIILIVTPQNIKQLQWHISLAESLGVVCVLAVLALAVWQIGPVRSRLQRFARHFWVSFQHYLRNPHRLVVAQLLMLVLTITYVSILYLCSHSLGVDLSFSSIFIVFTLGTILGTATPTPGGLGGAEAGLFAGLVAYKVDAASALAVVLLYRLLTYWLPLIPGFAALLIAQKKQLV